MAERRESVRLDLTGDLIPKTAEATAAMAAFREEVKRVDGTSVGASSSASKLERGVEDAGKAAGDAARDVENLDAKTKSLDQSTQSASKSFSNGSNEIDKYSGRLRVVGELLSIATPAIVGIGATTVAASAGMTAALGTVVTTVGTAIVAFQGVGDAVKALSTYNLQPTAQNLQAAQLALSQLGPDAAKFALEFERLTPTLHDIRDAAAAGWFPGLTRALDDMVAVAPKVESLFKAIGTAGGDAVAGFADDVKGGAFNDLFSFLQTEAPKAITALSAAGASVAHGLSQMLIATGSADDSFLSWVDKVADGFDRWASSAQGRQDIADFLDYVREQAPNVEHLITALAEAITGIVKAAAPLSGVTLKAFTAVAQAVANIANSDLGTPIVAGVIALSAYNRALAVTAALQKSAFGQALTGSRSAGSLVGGSGLIAGIRNSESMSAAAAALPSKQQFGQYLSYWGQSAKYASAETMEARAAVGAFGKSLVPVAASAAKTALPIAALGVASSGLADKMGLTSTASLALAGSFIAPGLGTGIGAVTGLTLDLAAANKALAASFESAQTAVSTMDFGNYSASLASAKQGTSAYDSTIQHISNASKFVPIAGSYIAGGLSHLAGSKNDDSATEYRDLQAAMLATEQTAAGLGRALGLTVGPLDGSARSAAELTNALQMAGPAMAALKTNATNLDIAHTFQLASQKGNPLGGLLRSFGVDTAQYAHVYTDSVEKIVTETSHLNSQAGRTQAVANAIKSIGTNSLNSANAATVLSARLDALTSPGMNLIQATDAWDTSLHTLDQQLNAHTKTLVGNSSAASANRDTFVALGGQLKQLLVTQAAHGASEAKLTHTYDTQRAALIATAASIGVNRAQLKTLLHEMGLTPNIVPTTFKSNAKQATSDVAGYSSQLDPLNGKTVTTHIDADASNLKAEVGAANHLLTELGLRHVTSTVTTVMRTVHTSSGRNDIPLPGHADGGYITGPGTGRSDSILAWLSNGEFVVNAAATARHLPLLHSLNAQRFADGGLAKHNPFTPLPSGAVAQDSSPSSSSSSSSPSGHTKATKDDTEATKAHAKQTREQSRHLKELNHRLNEANKVFDKQKSVVDGLRSSEQSLASAIRSSLTTDLFQQSDSGSSNIWAAGAMGVSASTVADPNSVLRGDIKNALTFRRLDQRLIKRGLSGQALAAAEQQGLPALQELAGYSGAQLRDYQQLYNRRAQLVKNDATTGAAAVYGKRLGDAITELKHLRGDVHQVKAAINAEHRKDRHENKRNSDDNAHKVADGVNHAATSGHKRSR